MTTEKTIKMQKPKQLLIYVSALFLVFTACQEEEFITPEAPDDSTLSRILSMGYSRDVIEDMGDYYLVEDDLAFKKSDKILTPKSHRQNSVTAKNGLQDRLKVKIDNSIPSTSSANWRDAIEDAIDEWNAIPNTMIHLELVSSSSAANITFKSVSFRQSHIALGFYPFNEIISADVWVDINHSSNYQQRIWGLAHALGHTVGIRHTDETFGTHIPGTPTSETNSMFNKPATNIIYTNPSGSFDFTSNDELAIQTVYPAKEDEYLIGLGTNGSFLTIRRGYALHHDIDMNGYTNIIQEYGNGNSEDQYISADWNGNGQSTQAVRRNNVFHIDNNGDLVIDEVYSFGFGNSEDQYLLGDWNADGTHTIAIRRGGQLDMDHTGNGIINTSVFLGQGNNEDQYLAGDWNNNGTWTFAFRRNDKIHIDKTGNGIVDQILTFGPGNSADEYVAGDWNGDGKTTLAYRDDNTFHIDSNGNGSVNYTKTYGYGTN